MDPLANLAIVNYIVRPNGYISIVNHTAVDFMAMDVEPQPTPSPSPSRGLKRKHGCDFDPDEEYLRFSNARRSRY